jgi:hypothetical protein
LGSGKRVWKPLGNRIKLAQRLWLLGKPLKRDISKEVNLEKKSKGALEVPSS